MKIFKVTGCYQRNYGVYVKLYWCNKKYKTKTRMWTNKFDEEFLLPIHEGIKDDDKLYVELWQSSLFNMVLARGSLKYIDIKNSWVNAPLKISYFLTVCYVNLTAIVVKGGSDALYNKMADMFPHLPAIQIKEAISTYVTESLIIEHLRNIEKTNMMYNVNPPVALPNQPNVVGMNALGNYNAGGPPGTNMANPVMATNVAVGGLENMKVIRYADYKMNLPVGSPSPYPEIYLYTAPLNKKKALLIGVNYYGTKDELLGCSNDTARMKTILITKYGFRDSPLTMIRLIDSDSNPDYRPTKKNILSALTWLTTDNKKGDVFFFLFSGHGSQKKDLKYIEEDGYNETILPCDHKEEGEIIDDDLHRYLIQPLHNGVKLIAVVDCCRSGTCLDLAYEYKIKKRKWVEAKNPFHVICDVTQFSSCRDDELSYEVDNARNAPGGSLVSSLIYVLNSHDALLTYEYLLNAIHENIQKYNKKQSLTFMSSQKFSVNSRIFDFNNIVENKNATVGQIMNSVSILKKKKLWNLR